MAVLAGFIIAVSIFAITGTTSAYPTPATVPYRWELEYKPGDLRLYVDPIDGRVYWYTTYKVINRTGEDQTWAPSFVLYTDEGEILTSGRDVPTRIEGTIRQLLGNDLLLTQNEAIGDLFHGKEHAI